MTTHPAAVLDRATRIQTISVLTIMGIAALLFGASGDLGTPIRVVVVAIIGLFVVGGWMRATTAYEVGDGHLVVRRRLWRPARFDITGGVEALAADAALGAIRWPGSSMVFGLRGRFWSNRLGHHRAYVTDRTATVRCTTGRGTVLVSPADVRAFIRDWKRSR